VSGVGAGVATCARLVATLLLFAIENMGIIKAKRANTAKDIIGVSLRFFDFAKIITPNQNDMLYSLTTSFVSKFIIYTLPAKMHK